MSLEKSINSGKDHRKQYRKGTCAAVHGGKGNCLYCSDGITHKRKVQKRNHEKEIRKELEK